jgi:two-component system nitrogen regulation response regulator GlnG
MKTVLIIDRHEDDRTAMQALLATRYKVFSCGSLMEASRLTMNSRPIAIVLDVDSTLINGIHDPTGTAAAIEPQAGVICSARSDSTADNAGWSKTCHYLKKPYRAESLYSIIRLAAAESLVESVAESPIPVQRYRTSGARADHRLIGDCPALRNIAHRIALYARSDAPVLILGESGTGKELAAAAIHRASQRCHGKFIPVDCASLPESLAESTLFGTVKGAYTDAVEKKGAFESAHGGTVFLDEIGELSFSVQAKFLRTLESSSGSRVGSVEQVPYNIRLLSATNAPLFGDRKRFRPELLHRIDTLVLEMPALREHKQDIPVLILAFLQEFSPDKQMTDKAVLKLMDWDWPGNVRELRNVVRRATVISGTNDEITHVDIEIGSASRSWQLSLF